MGTGFGDAEVLGGVVVVAVCSGAVLHHGKDGISIIDLWFSIC